MMTATCSPPVTQRPSIQFCNALYRMICEHPDAIQWDPTTGSLIIHDHPKNLEKTLSLYFRHHRFASFQRQLTNFGFHRIVGKKIIYRRAAQCRSVESSSISSAASALLSLKKKYKK